MKKFRFTAIAVLVLSVLALSGCDLGQQIWNEVKGETKNKWATVALKDVESDSGKYNLNVYLYYTDSETKDGRLELKPGLNVLIEADAGNAKFFGAEVTTATYALKTFGPNEEIKGGSKTITISDDLWTAIFAAGAVKESDTPASASSSSDYSSIGDQFNKDKWNEFLIDILLARLNV